MILEKRLSLQLTL